MITSIFKKSSPINHAFIFLMLLFFYGVYQFNHVGTVKATGFFAKKVFIITAIAASLFIANFVIKKNGLSKDNAYTFLFYSLLMLFFPSVMNNVDLIISNFFIILALRRLISLQSPKFSKEKLFDASLWIFAASVFHFWSILFLILVFVSILFHTARDFSAWFLPFIAFFASLLIFIFIDLVFKIHTISAIIANSSSDFKINIFDDNYQNASIFTFGIISLYFIFYLISTISSRPIILHSSYKKFLVAFFIGIAVFLISPNKCNDILIFTFFPLAFMITLFAESSKSKINKELTIIVVIGCSFFAFFSQL